VIAISSLLVGFAAPALAGDGSPAILGPSSWTGIYVGAHAGYAGSDSHWTYTNLNPYSGPAPGTTITTPGVNFSTSSAMGGVQAGANYQLGAIVLGGEVSFSGMNLGESRANPGQYLLPYATSTVRTETNNLLLVTGKVGWTWDPRWLAYVKGGYARADVETAGITNVLPSAPLPLPIAPAGMNFNTRDHQDGWAIGGGVEFKLSEHVGIAVEYMHVGLDSDLHVATLSNFPPPPFVVRHNVDADIDTVTARLNLHLNPVAALPAE
jgi:outer membrane immunogenic protein